MYLPACCFSSCQPPSSFPLLQVTTAHCQERCKLVTAQQKSKVLQSQNNQVRLRVPSGLFKYLLSASLCFSLPAGHNSSLSGTLQVSNCPAEEQGAAVTKQPGVLACTFRGDAISTVSLPLLLLACRSQQLIVRNATC